MKYAELQHIWQEVPRQTKNFFLGNCLRQAIFPITKRCPSEKQSEFFFDFNILD